MKMYFFKSIVKFTMKTNMKPSGIAKIKKATNVKYWLEDVAVRTLIQKMALPLCKKLNNFGKLAISSL
jgi:hypothetical protein